MNKWIANFRMTRSPYFNSPFPSGIGRKRDRIEWFSSLSRHMKGVTIAEILISIFIASLMLIPMSYLISHNERVGQSSLIRLKASALAMEKMEELKSLPFIDLEKFILDASESSDGPYHKVVLPLEEDPNWSEASAVYKRGVELNYFPYPDPASMKLSPADLEYAKYRIQIVVEVHYESRAIKGKMGKDSYRLATLMTREDQFKVNIPNQ